ncbi:hypothetical protein CHUAL_006963 [Chamberlinius hualienensis]
MNFKEMLHVSVFIQLFLFFIVRGQFILDEKMEDSQLLEYYYSIWKTIGVYPHGNYFLLRNEETGLCLSVQLASTHVFSGQIVGLTCHSHDPYQKFTFHHSSPGHFNLVPYYGHLVGVNNGITNETSALLGNWLDSYSHHYSFRLPFNDKSYFLLMNRGALNCLQAGFFISAWKCEEDESKQRWQVCELTNRSCWPRDEQLNN